MILMTLIRLIALLTGAKRREFSGMIHNRYYNNHPSNPQQPPATPSNPKAICICGPADNSAQLDGEVEGSAGGRLGESMNKHMGVLLEKLKVENGTYMNIWFFFTKIDDYWWY